MRLLDLQNCDLDSGKLTLIDTQGKRAPRYAILSHRWQSEEVLFTDIERGMSVERHGIEKVKGAVRQALRDGYDYLWIDSCCIDKSSSAELSEAINSMFRWYEESKVCYAFLSDVESAGGLASSEWFTRGWTLQELLASQTVHFYTKDWTLIGNKVSLQDQLSSITGISKDVLALPELMFNTSIARRMSWASGRETTRPEDMAYCLLGLFAINMPLLYGEGKRAFIRLQEEIIKAEDDFSIFAWKIDVPFGQTHRTHGLLAEDPSVFRDSGNIVPYSEDNEPFAMTNKGLSISLEVTARSKAILPCVSTTHTGDRHKRLAIAIEKIPGSANRYNRVKLTDISACTVTGVRRSMYFPQRSRTIAHLPAPYHTFRLYLWEVGVEVTPLRHAFSREPEESPWTAADKTQQKPNSAQYRELHRLLWDGRVTNTIRLSKKDTDLWLVININIQIPKGVKSHNFFDYVIGIMPNGELGHCLQPYDLIKGSLVDLLDRPTWNGMKERVSKSLENSFVSADRPYTFDIQVSRSSSSALLNRSAKRSISKRIVVTLSEESDRSQYENLFVDPSTKLFDLTIRDGDT